MPRHNLWIWTALSVLLLGGATWATVQIRGKGDAWTLVLLWFPLLLVVGLGLWFHRRPPEGLARDSLPSRLAGLVTFLTLFGVLDASVVAGHPLWRPMAFGFAVVHMLVGWDTDWTRFSSSMRWGVSLRRSAYFALGLASLAIAVFGDPYLALLLLMAMDLLVTPWSNTVADRAAPSNPPGV